MNRYMAILEDYDDLDGSVLLEAAALIIRILQGNLMPFMHIMVRQNMLLRFFPRIM